jgi:hypothetical protein
MNASTDWTSLSVLKTNAPTNAIPEIAFAPDIKGVCSVLGTLDISSKPKKIDSTKIKPKSNNVSILFKSLVSYFSVIYKHTIIKDLILKVKVKRLIFLIVKLEKKINKIIR